MPGPAPNPSRRRRNAPTVQTTNLPAGGRRGPAPDLPTTYELGDAGLEWWEFAWRLPQATRWDDGTVYAVARRAQLEDLLAALDFTDELDLADLLANDPEATRRVEWAIATLKRAASGALGLMKEMRELDKRLGLDPKALVELRWTIVDDGEGERPSGPAAPTVRRLRAVEAS
jgi:hypothetical protein